MDEHFYRIDNEEYLEKLSELDRLQKAHAKCSDMDLNTNQKNEFKINPKAGQLSEAVVALGIQAEIATSGVLFDDIKLWTNEDGIEELQAQAIAQV